MKIKLLKQLLCIGIMLCSGILFSQTVTGTVSDADGSLPGVSVLVKGTTTGTSTDFDGKYSLDNVASDAVLVFSFVGYKTQEVPVNGRSTIDVVLVTDSEALDEVVVIGYGQTTVKDATGAVSAVTSEDFNKGAIATPEQLIQGKTAGVQISSNSGEPGAGVALRIRGTTSVTANNNPLFVVDGIPLTGGSTTAEGSNIGVGTSAPKNPLAFLNPNDIESISILKDASATAIYGSRGANGVVIVTTKTGKAGQEGIWEYGANISFSKPAESYDLLGRDQFLSAVTQFGGSAADQDAGGNTDWQDVVTRHTVSHDQNLSYSRNYGSGSVRATVGYGEQFGVVENSSLERITGRVNLNQKFLDDKLKFNLQASISRVNDETPPLSGSAGFRGDLLGAAYSANPTWPNDPNTDTGGQTNPRHLIDYIRNKSNTDRFLVNLSTEYAFTNELSAKVTLGYDKSDSRRGAATSALARNVDQGAFGNGVGAINDLDLKNELLEATLNYNKDFGNSKLDALVGYSYQSFENTGKNVTGWGFNTTSLGGMVNALDRTADILEGTISGSYQQYGFAPNLSQVFINRLSPNIVTDNINAPAGLGVRSIFGDFFDTTDELQSFFGRVNYTIADKYLFTATVRADGSSKFGEDNRYGIFPSAAFAWKINEEDFIGDAFSTLKLRLNYGITGNQDGLAFGRAVERQSYPGGDIISDGGDINVPGATTTDFENRDLKWEETTQYGAGIDFGFADDRFTGTIDVYRKETTDLLLNLQAAQPSPQPFFYENFDAVVINQGIEFGIEYDIVRSDDFNWGASFNIAYNDNEIQDFDGLIPAGTIRGQGLSRAFSQILAGGQPLFSFFLREFEGFDSSGQPIGDVQSFVGKSALPTTTAGFSTNVSYKNWDFAAYFNGQFGNYIYNNTRNAFFTAGAIGNARNVTPDVLTSGESQTAEAAVSTRFLEKGDFIRFQTASIGYNVPLSGEGTFKSLRLSLTGQNLFVITDYTGLDPEVSVVPGSTSGDLLNGIPIAGIDYTGFPRPRTITFGFNATF